MSLPDDLPWPELGNVSRGATRGNQGQKGVLGPPDREGRCVLQLRVQPGVLSVRLNCKASEWYRILDSEVNRALKLTKTYWRKARRRQDYDARADQDHMELHEWLQQLKDKTMSHLELLMQKGDIQGPPYTMPDDMELTFLRKFVERQATGIPHNPRLRNVLGDGDYPNRNISIDSTPDLSNQGCLRNANVNDPNPYFTRALGSPFHGDGLTQEATSSKEALQAARMSLVRAQKDTQEAFMRYTTCLDIERQARMAVTAAEKRRDDIMALLARNQSEQDSSSCPRSAEFLNISPNNIRSRNSSFSGDDRRSPPRFPPGVDVRSPTDFFTQSRLPQKNMEWPEPGTHNVYTNDPVSHLEDTSAKHRKHARTWDAPQLPDTQYSCEDMDMSSLPPRKRMHHIMPGFDVLGHEPGAASLHPHNMTLPP
ncbi:hypothetical protein AX15_000330 [Amanita polypyramis BW_CC]|nr:hypothetical protein AX15_000330 [Amanita polypyramis BW_CC]